VDDPFDGTFGTYSHRSAVRTGAHWTALRLDVDAEVIGWSGRRVDCV
jgi:hypothetical protein